MMTKRISSRLATLILAGLTSIAAGCMVDEEGPEAEATAELEQIENQEAAASEDQSLAASEDRNLAASEDKNLAGQPPTTNIQVNDYNGICADTLTLRDVPGGYTLCTMTYKNAVYAYSVNGAWAYIRVLAGRCEGHVGWALKDYISRRCL
jgi:hypothetical protein